MPKVTQVTAAKDYPKLGIAKGEKCYVWRVRLSRGGVDCRSKTYPRPSQLNFGFAGRIGDIELDFDNAENFETIEQLKSDLEELKDETQGSFDNMPEGLQQGDTGQLLEERVQNMEQWISDIESAISDYDTAVDGLDDKSAEDLKLDEDADEDEIEAKREEIRGEALDELKEAISGANPGF
jgi:hypothetical protein